MNREQILGEVRLLVEAESPSANARLLAECVDVLRGIGAERLGIEPDVLRSGPVDSLLWSFGPSPRILLLGHYDTVWPEGTIDRWPLTIDGDTVSGPGVFDMKAGIVQGFEILSRLDRRDDVAMLLVADEEIGSPNSRETIQRIAEGMDAVVVLEPNAEGAFKTGRSGSACYEVLFKGVAAHAGLAPERGVNAISAAGEWIARVERLGNPAVGTTVVVTQITGGSAANTVPAAAQLTVDVRAVTRAEQHRVDCQLRALRTVSAAATISVGGGVNRPPLERHMSQPLFDELVRIAEQSGRPAPRQVAVGGASDGNLTAALGVLTLDGAGPTGDRPHAEGEWVSLASIGDRSALITTFVEHLLRTRLTRKKA